MRTQDCLYRRTAYVDEHRENSSHAVEEILVSRFSRGDKIGRVAQVRSERATDFRQILGVATAKIPIVGKFDMLILGRLVRNRCEPANPQSYK